MALMISPQGRPLLAVLDVLRNGAFRAACRAPHAIKCGSGRGWVGEVKSLIYYLYACVHNLFSS